MILVTTLEFLFIRAELGDPRIGNEEVLIRTDLTPESQMINMQRQQHPLPRTFRVHYGLGGEVGEGPESIDPLNQKFRANRRFKNSKNFII